MGEGLVNLFIGAEVEDLGGEAACIGFVIEGDGVDSDEGGDEVEVQVGTGGECAGPVVGDDGLAFEVTGGLVDYADDDG